MGCTCETYSRLLCAGLRCPSTQTPTKPKPHSQMRRCVTAIAILPSAIGFCTRHCSKGTMSRTLSASML